METYLTRYLSGDHVPVWQELVSLGDLVRAEPLYSDALAVARETMRRVRRNLEMLMPRLTEVGYQFGYEELDVRDEFAMTQPQPFQPAGSDIKEILARFEEQIGILPLSLYAWYEEIREVNFVGKAPDSWSAAGFIPEVYQRYAGAQPWKLSLDSLAFYTEHPELLKSSPSWLDPIQVISLDDQFDLYGDWQHEKNALDLHDVTLSDEERHGLLEKFAAFRVEISPDASLKLDQSGLGAYEIAVPSVRADAALLNEWHDTTFVEYLRICIRWAGFPGLELYRNPPKELAALTEGLLPF